MTETRPWGYYNTLYLDDGVCQVKMIVVFPLKRLSLQSHTHRSEHWVIVKGNAKMQIGNDTLFLQENQHVYIPKGVLHRIENTSSSQNLEFMETQLGHYLGEDDIVRYDDDYGRK